MLPIQAWYCAPSLEMVYFITLLEITLFLDYCLVYYQVYLRHKPILEMELYCFVVVYQTNKTNRTWPNHKGIVMISIITYLNILT